MTCVFLGARFFVYKHHHVSLPLKYTIGETSDSEEWPQKGHTPYWQKTKAWQHLWTPRWKSPVQFKISGNWASWESWSLFASQPTSSIFLLLSTGCRSLTSSTKSSGFLIHRGQNSGTLQDIYLYQRVVVVLLLLLLLTVSSHCFCALTYCIALTMKVRLSMMGLGGIHK